MRERKTKTVGCLPDACSTPLFPFLGVHSKVPAVWACSQTNRQRTSVSPSTVRSALAQTPCCPLHCGTPAWVLLTQEFFSSLEPCNSHWSVPFPLLLPKGFFPTLPQDPCALYNINLNYPYNFPFRLALQTWSQRMLWRRSPKTWIPVLYWLKSLQDQEENQFRLCE